ncbi:type IV pilus secretin PilQ [Comamonadaceae bacterium BS-T2-15]|uniref:Type IV pilus biogenesis and competence protein PilQ n=2 Tax=Scleromatobacter humisilvae TaxID=2897159 RepID=A0A9X2C1M8_9BURK|nr:type IV pilus secretin PilQ [Scleromatobacter humisilvae]MCK9688983.1 type IV pilus secretin PilQ [Scleromatobacter humisilvae]
MRSWTAGAALVLALGLAFPMASWAEPRITSVTGLQQGGTDVVRVELSEPLKAVPAGFVVQAPPRVAIDLPGVTNSSGKSSIEVNQGNVRSVSVASSGDRTRLVLNLKVPSSYRAEIQGNSLLISLDTGAAPAAASTSTTTTTTTTTSSDTHFANSQNADVLPLRDIDFRRGADGAGRIVVNLASTQVGVDLKQQGKDLVVDFLRSSAPDRLRRRLDVSDFGTPVQTVTTTQAGDHVHMVVTPTGAWEHSAYQTDNQFVLEVRPAKNDPNKLVPGQGYTGQRLSLNFQSIEIRALLQIIADFSDFNVVTSDSVTGTVTLRLKDVPWDQALDIILQSKGLDKRRSGNVLLIAPKDELAAKEQVDLEAKKKIADLEPMHMQAFQLNYTKAIEVANGLTGAGASGGTRMLSIRGSVIAESRTNQLFVTDIPAKLEEIQALIARIDVAQRQVMIEARIVEASDNFGRALGVKLGTTSNAFHVGGSQYVGVGGNYNAVATETGQTVATTFPLTDGQFVNFPAPAGVVSSTATAASFALSLFSASASRFLNLELSALEEDGTGRIISSPRVITADQVQAVVEAGEELPYQQATSSGATSVSFQKAQIRLQVTPQITPEGNVILDVDVNKDSVGRSTSAGFAIDTKHVKTTALVENGGTVVLGGLFQQNEQNVTDKVPFLGDIPFLGNLFKNTSKLVTRTELLIFITPRIITDRTAAH